MAASKKEKPIIEVKHLSKQYNIGIDRTYKTFCESFTYAVRHPLKTLKDCRRPNDTFWALKDVNFEIERGEVVGIIGRNGAGKSTLLKILSRITYPTEGEITMRGRVGSLLEVGTGFHPELTGRENIYFNGAILGMKKKEIDDKFDEIVKFSGVEKFLDTPVKRYSSGMQVRLAFSVAANLDPEILVVDEVLAVGDAEFQKKCLGKMSEVAKGGRTVLFVSHNLGAIQSLCNRAILLQNGIIIQDSNSEKAIAQYMGKSGKKQDGFVIREGFNPDSDLLESVELFDGRMNRQTYFTFNETMFIRLKTNANITERFGLEVRIKNSKQEYIGYSSSWIQNGNDGIYTPGETILIRIPNLKFVQDTYTMEFNCRIPQIHHVDAWWDCLQFTITNCRPYYSPISIKHSDQWGNVVFDEISFSRCDINA